MIRPKGMTTGPHGPCPLLAVLLSGFAVGSFVKLADESALANQLGLNDLGTFLGLWVVIVAALAVWSPSARQAALRVSGFLVTMVAAYYVVTWQLFGVFSVFFWLAWTAVALSAAPLLAILVWQAQGRQGGWLGALGAALPVGLLLWEAYSLRFVATRYLVQIIFDLVAAVMLVALLPGDRTERARAVLLTPLVVFAAGVGFTRILPRLLALLLGRIMSPL